MNAKPHTWRLDHLVDRFNTEYGEAQNAIAAGSKVTEYDAECLLADKYHEMREDQAPTREEEEYGRALIVNSGREKGSATRGWGTVAYKTHRAVEKMHAVAMMND